MVSSTPQPQPSPSHRPELTLTLTLALALTLALTRTLTLALTLTLTLPRTEVAVLLEAKGAYSGVSIRKLAQSRSPLRRSAEACVVPLSLGDNARNFDAFTQQGVIALGSELEISIEVRAS